MIDKVESQKLVIYLLTKYRIESIAHKIDRSWNAVYSWAKGKTVPSQGDYLQLLTLKAEVQALENGKNK